MIARQGPEIFEPIGNVRRPCWKVVCRGVKGCGGVGTDEGQDTRDASLI